MNGSVKLAPLLSIKELLKLYNIKALKKLSQNFLLDLRLTDKIVKAAGTICNGEVCEVGPGPGAITRSIINNNPDKVILIEKDQRFKPVLENLADASYCKVDLIFSDILDFDLARVFTSNFKRDWDDDPPNIHLIGNLPFSVSTPLIIRWLKDISMRRSAWSHGRVKMTLTFQQEVGERMVAPACHAQRCRMSIMCQNWCDVHFKFTIPGSAFLPKPEVDVAVVHLTPRRESFIPFEFDVVEKILRTVFNSRRKYIVRTVGHLFPVDLKKGLTMEMLKRAEVNPQARPYQLEMEEWGRLCHAYKFICDRDPRLYKYDFRGQKEFREKIWKTEKGDDDDDDEEKKEKEKEQRKNVQESGLK